MMLTTKGRYAVMCVVDIAYNSGKGEVLSLQQIAERQDLKINYLEQIFLKLKKNKIVDSIRGPGGGYCLSRHPKDINIFEIIDAVNESIKMTRCDNNSPFGCRKNQLRCLTHDLWAGLSNNIKDYLSGVSIEDICKRNRKKLPCGELAEGIIPNLMV